MYQGKFDRKQKTEGRSVPKKAATGPRLGTLVFYTLFFFSILVFYIATYFGLRWFQGWLTQYELAQPTMKSQSVFASLFESGDWASLYDAAGFQDTLYESKDTFVSYMQDLTAGEQLTFVETSTGLSEDKKYLVNLGQERIASFTLVNQADSETEIPNWQLGKVELLLDRGESVRVTVPNGCTPSINAVPLDDGSIVKISSPKAVNYLPEGTKMPGMTTYEVTGLLSAPQVTATDETGGAVALTYDETVKTYTASVSQQPMDSELEQLALEAVETYALYMLKKAGAGDLSQYFLKGSDAYRAITDTERGFVQEAQSFEFVEESVTEYTVYTDNLFSARVSVTLNEYRSSGTVKESPISQTLFFEKQSSGKWMCYAMTAIDTTEATVQVRIRFVDQGREVASDLYDLSQSGISCPAVTPPEGKKFQGWGTESQDEQGNTVMNLILEPDETGFASIPDGLSEEPIALYAVFQ